eukprot:TRINITY_DN6455_c0_g1_i2.p1 TRINITY_DN6455_c0_g1~~TRINITY_DN6455_c0_g1_i2.p1  ORF type:complete len:459 (+),score=49.14 TRINITY_DN6455_c0_g1_i2:176-1552(+)
MAEQQRKPPPAEDRSSDTLSISRPSDSDDHIEAIHWEHPLEEGGDGGGRESLDIPPEHRSMPIPPALDSSLMSGINLHHFPTSLSSRIVRMVLAEKGLGWSGDSVNVYTLRHLNPKYMRMYQSKGTIPLLVHACRSSHPLPAEPVKPAAEQTAASGDGDENDGDVPSDERRPNIVTGTRAIAQYIETMFPDRRPPQLFPDPGTPEADATNHWLDKLDELPMDTFTVEATRLNGGLIGKYILPRWLRYRKRTLLGMKTNYPEHTDVYERAYSRTTEWERVAGVRQDDECAEKKPSADSVMSVVEGAIRDVEDRLTDMLAPPPPVDDIAGEQSQVILSKSARAGPFLASQSTYTMADCAWGCTLHHIQEMRPSLLSEQHYPLTNKYLASIQVRSSFQLAVKQHRLRLLKHRVPIAWFVYRRLVPSLPKSLSVGLLCGTAGAYYYYRQLTDAPQSWLFGSM